MKEALKLTLEALEQLDGIDTETECVTIDVGDVMEAIKKALAQPEQADDGCSMCGSDVHDRDALDKAEREIDRLTALVAQSKQEPCKTCNGTGEVQTGIGMMVCDDCHGITYTTPPQPKEQEPVAWHVDFGNEDEPNYACLEKPDEPTATVHPLIYGDTTTPSQRTWVDLTDDEFEAVWLKHHDEDGYLRDENQEGWAYEKELLAKLKEKNT